jgi:signal transduction histidine kinase
MNLKQEILNIFNRNRTDECSIEPVDFFSGEKASQLLQSLNCTSAYPQGLSPIETLSLKIARISRAEYIVLTRFTDDEKLKIEAIAQPDNSLKSATKYFSTQSVSAILKGGIAYSNNPDEILSAIGQNHHKAKSFTALLIHDNENNPVGAAFGFSKSSNNEKTLLNTLRFFTFNITSELSHLINKEKLENKNKELLHTEEELKLKNQLLDNLNKNISKAKQVVDESSRLKSAFLANLIHEIRTPKNVIMGFTELLNADNMTNGQRRNYIDIIQQNGTRLLHIMDSLIDISRFQAKNVGKEQQSFSLNQMMQQLHNNFQSEIDVTGKPLTLRLKIDSKEGQDIVTLDKE